MTTISSWHTNNLRLLTNKLHMPVLTLPVTGPAPFLTLDTAFGPVKSNPETFVVAVSGKRVVYINIVGVFDDRRVLVININLLSENTIVPYIAVVVFVFGVKLTQMVILANIPIVGTFIGMSMVPPAAVPAVLMKLRRVN